MITSVTFHVPVVFVSVGTEHWSLVDSQLNGKSCSGVTCTDKSTHMLFTVEVRGKRRRIRVPLTNIAQVTEEDEPKGGKEEP